MNRVADKLITPDFLKSQFAEHLSTLANKDNLEEIGELWQDIAKRYRDPTRAYHTLQHLQQLFTQFEKVKYELQQPSIIALALFYHDVIYDPKRTDNELKSTEYAQEVLKSCVTAESIERVSELIMMTADHKLADKTDLDAAYLLDMDLSVLGASWLEYEQYAKAVRQEYSYVSEVNYRVGRAKVLNALLEHPRLYLADYYYQRLEIQARENIAHEITWLAV